MILITLILTAVTVKHPGFDEEKEWRAIYLSKQLSSTRLIQAVETIGGIPQLIHKLPLKDIPEAGINGLDVAKVIDRVIVGPSGYPGPVAAAFVAELKEAGIADAEKRVVISDIPLRPA
jgi:hypothetical protein